MLPSAGEMMVGSKTVFFMDEISTGLDSSTTYAIVKFLRDQTHALNYTTMISLLQPAPESYDLFDDILLLAEGTLLHLLAFLCIACVCLSWLQKLMLLNTSAFWSVAVLCIPNELELLLPLGVFIFRR